MSEQISGKDYPLKQIFSSEFEYHIPPYQRPYAWTTEQASELFEDLYDSYQSKPEEDYFLGSIVLIKESNRPCCEVIDGQQRLTTLTILLSALASSLEGERRDKLHKEYICEPGNEFEGLEKKPRLTLRDKDKEFFSDYVQSLEFEECSKNPENQSQKNIKDNSQLFIQKIKNCFDNNDDIVTFTQFLLTKCFLVAVSTPTQESAYRVFSIMNTRGLDLQTTDIIKADIIGQLKTEEDRKEYSKRWENMEDELKRRRFNDLFTYIRMIYAKKKAQKSLLEDFKEHVLKRVGEPKQLISDVLEPYADALARVLEAKSKLSSHADRVDDYLSWLNRIDNSDWIPVAILFLSKNENSPDYVEWFFSRLERLAAFMHICAQNINQRIERYSKILEELENEHSIDSPSQAVELTDGEKEQMRERLDEDIYGPDGLTHARRKYLILRLDSFISDRSASYDTKHFTIEHVLPQTISTESEWAKWWPDKKQREQWVHRIANLVPLNRVHNSKAQNYDFATKKETFFGCKEGVSSYSLTTRVLHSNQWMPEDLEARQEELLGVLEDKWRLGE